MDFLLLRFPGCFRDHRIHPGFWDGIRCRNGIHHEDRALQTGAPVSSGKMSNLLRALEPETDPQSALERECRPAAVADDGYAMVSGIDGRRKVKDRFAPAETTIME
jgi:hypothetical protein